MYLLKSWLALSCVISVYAASSRLDVASFKITSNLKNITYITPLVINCSYPGVTQSSTPTLQSLIVKFGSTVLASVTVLKPFSPNLIRNVGQTLSGRVDNIHGSYLQLVFTHPRKTQEGDYQCTYNGMDTSGHYMTSDVKVHVSRIGYKEAVLYMQSQLASRPGLLNMLDYITGQYKQVLKSVAAKNISPYYTYVGLMGTYVVYHTKNEVQYYSRAAASCSEHIKDGTILQYDDFSEFKKKIPFLTFQPKSVSTNSRYFYVGKNGFTQSSRYPYFYGYYYRNEGWSQKYTTSSSSHYQVLCKLSVFNWKRFTLA